MERQNLNANVQIHYLIKLQKIEINEVINIDKIIVGKTVETADIQH